MVIDSQRDRGMKSRNILFFAAIMMTACTGKKNDSGLNLENMNQTVRPGDNFYEYSDGGWMKNHPLTAEYSSYGSFDELAELNRQQLKDLIDGIVSSDNKPGTNAQKIADLYNLVLDTARRNSEGIEPLKSVLDRIGQIKTRQDYFDALTDLDPYGAVCFFGIGIGADMMDSRKNIVGLSQGGLSLGSREQYFDEDDATKANREAFRRHVVRMFCLVGNDEQTAEAKMQAVWNIEMQIAEKSYTRVMLRDPKANYHKMSVEQLKKDFAGFDWDMFFSRLGLDGVDSVDVGQPEPIREAIAIINNASVDDLKSVMEWQVIDASASSLTTELDE